MRFAGRLRKYTGLHARVKCKSGESSGVFLSRSREWFIEDDLFHVCFFNLDCLTVAMEPVFDHFLS